MSSRYFVLAAVLLSTGWSSRVAYKSHLSHMKSRAIVSRSIASQLDQLNMNNIKEEAQKINEMTKKLSQSKEDLIAELKHSSLKELIKDSKEEKIKNIKDIRDQLRERLSKAELFVAKIERDVAPEPKEVPEVESQLIGEEEKFQESDEIDAPEITLNDKAKEGSKLLSEVNKSLQASRKIVDEFNIVDFEMKLDQALEVAMQEKAVEQERNLGDLNSKICSQNEKIDSLTEKLEKLLKDKEKVVEEMDEDDKDKKKEEKDNQLMAGYLNPALFMSPSQFFGQGLFAQQQNSGPDLSFLNSSPQMGGMDMNFLMLTSLLGQNTGMGALGGRTNITYSPVYYNNQGYSVPTSMSNLGSGNFSLQQGLPGMPGGQVQQQLQNPFALDQNGQMIPSFPRSNALQSNNTSTHLGMGITPNSQAL